MTPPAPRMGSAMNARDGLRAFPDDQVLEVADDSGTEVALAFRAFGIPVVMGPVGVQYLGNRQVEVRVKRRQAGERAGHDGGAVVTAETRDDLFSSPACRWHLW